MKKVSIIMVNYNGEKYLGKKNLIEAVTSFLKTDYQNFEFIFFDNNSCRNTIKIVDNIAKRFFRDSNKSSNK